jgi:hypothetical protein
MANDRDLEHARTAPRNNRIWLFLAAAVAFIVIVVGGSYFTSRHMNETADNHGTSAGRPGDPSPNLMQTRQNDSAARGGQSTTGSTPSSR